MGAATGSIVRLAEVSLADEPAVGGKAANLGALLAGGFPVPPGFVLTVGAHRRALDAAGVTEELRAAAATVDVEDPAALAGVADDLRRRVVAAGMADDLRAEVLAAHEALVGPEGVAPGARVAVRSSAVGEDGAGASHAGVLASSTDVDGGDELVDRVVACWASGLGARALAYRAGLDAPGEVGVGVVVQVMVEAHRSGVAFSLDPTGARDVSVVEAALGLGEVVVGGLVEPDTYLVARDGPSVVEERRGHQRFRIASSAGGGRREDLDDGAAEAQVLTHDEVLAVAEVARRVEALHGAPQDVEFAIDHDGRLHVLQARPVTTLAGGTGSSCASAEARGGAGDVPRGDGVPGLDEGAAAIVLAEGIGAAPGRAVGRVRVLDDPEDLHRLERGEVLVTATTSPEWLPALRLAGAVVTDLGGMTSHAAIVSRELGLPAVVGTRTATTDLRDGQLVAVDGTDGVVTPPAEVARPDHGDDRG